MADAARHPLKTYQNVREELRPLLSHIASEGTAGAEIARLIERAGNLGDVGAGKRAAARSRSLRCTATCGYSPWKSAICES